MKIFLRNIGLLLFMISCTENQIITNNLFKTERFSLSLPSNCIHKTSDYLDSQYGEINCKDFLVSYDHGFCNYSSSEAHSRQDFLEQNRWIPQVIPKLVPKGKEVSLDTVFNKIKILSVDKDQLSASFEFENKLYRHKIFIPSYLKRLFEKTDTTNGVITRIIYDKESLTEVNCYKINTSKFNPEKTCNESLIVRISSKKPLDTLTVFNFMNSIKFPIDSLLRS